MIKEKTKKTQILPSQWSLLFDFLKRRFVESKRNPGYVIYFITVIFLVGTFGAIKKLIEIKWCWKCDFDVDQIKSLGYSFSSIGLSLVTASVVDLIFMSKKRIGREIGQDEFKNQKVDNLKISIRMFGLGSLILTFVIWILINNIFENSFVIFFWSVLSLLFSYLIWWISNARNKILRGKFNQFGTLGKKQTTTSDGSISASDKNDKNLSGDVSNFRVN